jgi:hypothetical protein
MKCEICKGKINENFLSKLFGTYVKDKKGKLHTVCNNCQRQLKKDEMLAKF